MSVDRDWRVLKTRSPAQVGCMRQALHPGALGKPRGSGWRGGWEGGSGWGTHVSPWLFHFNVWQNPLQIKKLKKKKKDQALKEDIQDKWKSHKTVAGFLWHETKRNFLFTFIIKKRSPWFSVFQTREWKFNWRFLNCSTMKLKCKG